MPDEKRSRMIGYSPSSRRCWCPMCRDPRSINRKARRAAKRRERQGWKRFVR